MKRKLILISVVFSIFASFEFKAASLYANNGTEVASGSSICANDSYFYKTKSNGMYEAEIIDGKNSTLLATSNSKNGEIELVFPLNASSLTIRIFEYKDQQRSLVDTMEFTVSDCGYEVVKEDYTGSSPLTKITKTDEGYQFTEPEQKNYKLYVNQLEEDDDGTSQKIRFKDGVGKKTITADILQITETYTNDKGKSVKKFYEIDFTDGMVIRELSNIDLNIIEPMDYIDKNILVRIMISMMIIVVLFLMKVVLAKRYNARREYLLKVKRYHERQRELERQQKLKQQQLKKRKEQALRQKQLESERRANLGIRK